MRINTFFRFQAIYLSLHIVFHTISIPKEIQKNHLQPASLNWSKNYELFAVQTLQQPILHVRPPRSFSKRGEKIIGGLEAKIAHSVRGFELLKLAGNHFFSWEAANGIVFHDPLEIQKEINSLSHEQLAQLGITNLTLELNDQFSIEVYLAGKFPQEFRTTSQWRNWLSSALTREVKIYLQLKDVPNRKLLIILADDDTRLANSYPSSGIVIVHRHILDSPEIANGMMLAILAHEVGFHILEVPSANKVDEQKRRTQDLRNIIGFSEKAAPIIIQWLTAPGLLAMTDGLLDELTQVLKDRDKSHQDMYVLLEKVVHRVREIHEPGMSWEETKEWALARDRFVDTSLISEIAYYALNRFMYGMAIEFVRRRSKRFARDDQILDQLVADAYIKVTHYAIPKFRIEENTSLLGYFKKWITLAFQDASPRLIEGKVGFKREAQYAWNQIKKKQAELRKRFGHEPSDEMVAAELPYSADRIRALTKQAIGEKGHDLDGSNTDDHNDGISLSKVARMGKADPALEHITTRLDMLRRLYTLPLTDLFLHYLNSVESWAQEDIARLFGTERRNVRSALNLAKNRATIQSKSINIDSRQEDKWGLIVALAMVAKSLLQLDLLPIQTVIKAAYAANDNQWPNPKTIKRLISNKGIAASTIADIILFLRIWNKEDIMSNPVSAREAA